MSCYRIEYRDGKKIMLPVGSKAEYLQLRGSRRQKELLKAVRGGDDDAKRKLLQFNYSCIPGEDGMLKGCTQMSDTIGMDIDHIQPKLMAETALKILDMKEELGLLMLEKSARGQGYHLVMKRKTHMSQEENLQWASKKLGVEYDKGAKDITRVFFATTEEQQELLFVSPSLFLGNGAAIAQQEERAEAEDKGPCDSRALLSKQGDDGHIRPPKTEGAVAEGAAPESAATEGAVAADVTKKLPLGGQGGCASLSLLPYSQIIPAFFKKENSAYPDVPEGTRNDTVFNVVAKYLRYCTDHSWEKIKGLIYPEYSFGLPEAEVDSIITSALSRERSLTPRVVKDIIANARTGKDGIGVTTPSSSMGEGCPQGGIGAADVAADGAVDGSSYLPPAPPRRLCRLHQLLVRNFDARYTPMILLASIPDMAAHAAHYMGEYINGNIVGAQDFVAVIGDSGSGKGNATALHNMMVENTLQASDFMEFEKERANAEEREKKANAKDRPAKYHPRLRLFETASFSSILDMMSHVGTNGMLLGHFAEADAFCVGGGSTMKQLSTLFRKGWSGEVHTQYYLSDNSCNTMTRMRLAVTICGTVNSIVGGILSGKNTENGFMQRFIPVVMPSAKRTFRPPVGNRLTADEKAELQAMLVKLYAQDCALDETTITLELPKTRKVVERWYDALEERYNNGEITEAEADLSKRVGEHMMRTAIPLVAMEGTETKEMLEFIKWVGDISHYNLCWIFGHCVQKNLDDARELMGSHEDLRRTAEPLLAKLPAVFTVQQMRDVRKESGQSDNCNTLLSRYVSSGKLKRVGRGVYSKLTINN